MKATLVGCPQGHAGPLVKLTGAYCDTCGYQSKAWIRNRVEPFEYPVLVPQGCVREQLRHNCGGRFLFEVEPVAALGVEG